MSFTRKVKKNLGIIKKPYDWCKECKERMLKKEGYCYICHCCGKEKPLERSNENAE